MQVIQQRNLQVFFVPKDSNFDELERFIAKNKAMLKLYLLIIEELTPQLKDLLEQCEIDYIKPKNQHFGKNIPDLKKESVFDIGNSSKKVVNLTNQRLDSANHNANLLSQNANQSPNLTNIKVFTEIIRSGKEISSESDIIVFNRVNSGANIKSSKNVFVFGKCDGNIDCRGDYMVLSKIAKGKILFKGLAITPNMLKYKLNLITKDHIGLKIDDILSL